MQQGTTDQITGGGDLDIDLDGFRTFFTHACYYLSVVLPSRFIDIRYDLAEYRLGLRTCYRLSTKMSSVIPLFN